MKKIITLISMAMHIIFTPAYSQPTEEWVARYDSTGVDQLYDMTVDALGNVYATGASIQGTVTPDYLTVKYNSSGVKQWKKAFNGTEASEDRARAMAVDASGNVYVTGSTGYNHLIVTIKYNSLGDTLWVRSYNGPKNGNNTYPTSIAVDDSGYVYVAGTSEGLTGPNGLFDDFTLIKYSPSGVKKWASRYNGSSAGTDVILSMVVDPLGAIYVTGYEWGGSGSWPLSGFDMTTIKYNTSGTLIWKKNYKSVSSDQGNKVTIRNNYIYVTGYGYTDSLGTGTKDILTIKYNTAGTLLWKNFFNGAGNNTDEGVDLTVDSLNNVYVTGKSYYSSTNGFDMITVKYDSLGTQLWANNFNGSSNSNDVSKEITLDKNGNIYVLGTTVNITTADDYQLIKYTPAGTQQWEKKYTNLNGVGNQEEAVSLFVDGFNNIYAAGMSVLDYAVVKYSQPTGLEHWVRQSYFTLYPNPSNGKFTIKKENTEVDVIEIYNILGEKIYDALNIKHQTLTEIKLLSHSKGIYFVKIKAGANIYTEKIVIQ